MDGAKELMKIAWNRNTGHRENDSRSPSRTVHKTGSKRWWDSVLVGLGMTAIFVVIVLKLTGMLPK